MEISTYDELFVYQLADIYDAEQQILKALPKMAKSTKDSELKSAFQKHIDQTVTQIGRLEQIFDMMDQKPKAITCKGMKGLLEEGEESMEIVSEIPAIKDAALIAAARKVEHYEIAAYSGLILLAQSVELDEAEELLAQTLKEEQETDVLLSQQELVTA